MTKGSVKFELGFSVRVFVNRRLPLSKFSPRKVLFPQQSISPQEINFPYFDTKFFVLGFSEQTQSQTERSTAKSAKMHVSNILIVEH